LGSETIAVSANALHGAFTQNLSLISRTSPDSTEGKDAAFHGDSMKRLLLLLLCVPAFAAGPFSVNANVTAPTTGGVVDSYVLFLDGAEAGEVVEGENVLTDILTENKVYVFEVAAVNEFGSTMSKPVEFDARAPGQATFTITVFTTTP
jgi:hypothetical protein